MNCIVGTSIAGERTTYPQSQSCPRWRISGKGEAQWLSLRVSSCRRYFLCNGCMQTRAPHTNASNRSCLREERMILQETICSHKRLCPPLMSQLQVFRRLVKSWQLSSSKVEDKLMIPSPTICEKEPPYKYLAFRLCTPVYVEGRSA